MTGVSHQMIALLAALWLLTLYPISLGPLLGILALMAVMVGALTPDLDHPASNMWRRMLGGWAIGNVFQWFSGGHRHVTHSLLGVAAIAYATHWAVYNLVAQPYQAAALSIWYAYMIGYISHPIADTLTDRGVPWLWPLKINFRFPPGPEQVRVTTGSFVENLIVRGGLIAAAALIIFRNWPTLLYFFGWS